MLPTEQTKFHTLLLKDSFIGTVPNSINAEHLYLGCSDDSCLAFVRKLVATPSILGSPRSLAFVIGDSVTTNDLQRLLLGHEDIRRALQFFATNLPLFSPLLPMKDIRGLCLGRFADVAQLRQLCQRKHIAELIITGHDVQNLEDMRLSDVCESLVVPESCNVSDNFGIPVSKYPKYSSYGHQYEAHSRIWADRVERLSSSPLNVDHYTLCTLDGKRN